MVVLGGGAVSYEPGSLVTAEGTQDKEAFLAEVEKSGPVDYAVLSGRIPLGAFSYEGGTPVVLSGRIPLGPAPLPFKAFCLKAKARKCSLAPSTTLSSLAASR